VVPYSTLLGSIDDRQSRFQGGFSLFQRNKDYNSYTISDNSEQSFNEVLLKNLYIVLKLKLKIFSAI